MVKVKQEMNKVYCKNCEEWSSFDGYGCIKKWSKKTYNSAAGKWIKEFKYYRKGNEDNNCPHYYRKWFKFWVQR